MSPAPPNALPPAVFPTEVELRPGETDFSAATWRAWAECLAGEFSAETDAPVELQNWATEAHWEPSESIAARTEAHIAPAHRDYLLRLYLRDIWPEPILTDEEEKQCAWSAHFGDAAARERLVVGNLRLVVHIALHYRNLGLSLADLINEGNLGLIEAANRFDPLRGTRFPNYAGHWIRQRMRRSLDNHARTVRRPANFSAQLAAVRQAEAELLAAGNPQPTDAALATQAGVSPWVARQMRQVGAGDLSLDAPAAGARPLAETLPDESAAIPDAALAQEQEYAQLQALLNTLPARERAVLSLRHGLDGSAPRTLDETGQALGLSRQRTHQLEFAALQKLRLAMARR